MLCLICHSQHLEHAQPSSNVAADLGLRTRFKGSERQVDTQSATLRHHSGLATHGRFNATAINAVGALHGRIVRVPAEGVSTRPQAPTPKKRVAPLYVWRSGPTIRPPARSDLWIAIRLFGALRAQRHAAGAVEWVPVGARTPPLKNRCCAAYRATRFPSPQRRLNISPAIWSGGFSLPRGRVGPRWSRPSGGWGWGRVVGTAALGMDGGPQERNHNLALFGGGCAQQKDIAFAFGLHVYRGATDPPRPVNA